jgi:glyoxylase-like metal-dependent hydrolase (beta-lactamase superfamily II)
MKTKDKIKLHLFDTGYCLNFENMVARNKAWSFVRFYAMSALIEHPDFGPILFDTGYSQHVTEACKYFPFLFYKIAAPYKQTLSAAERIQQYGYKAEDVEHIIISHFHADHIGGLKDFPNAQFHYLQSSYDAVKECKGFSALLKGFLPQLIPDNFYGRSLEIRDPIELSYPQFNKGYDLFGDQSIIGIELPGHAEGQLGILLNNAEDKVFLIADACWQSSNYQSLELPNLIGRLAISDYQAYCSTLHKLNQFHLQFPEIKMIPSHCLEMWKKECIC